MIVICRMRMTRRATTCAGYPSKDQALENLIFGHGYKLVIDEYCNHSQGRYGEEVL